MKTCPTCSKVYTDGELNYCLADGAILVEKVPARGHSRANEILAIALMALGVIIFLCLVSYHPTDPNFNTSSSEKVRNWIGIVGSYTSDLFFQTIGSTAYLIPAIFWLAGWRAFNAVGLRPGWRSVTGCILLVLSLSGLLSLIGWHGGLIGAMAAESTTYLMRAVGSAILLLTMLAASVLLLTEFSFVGIFDRLEMPLTNLKAAIAERFAKRETRPADIAGERRNKGERRSGPLADPATIKMGETQPVINSRRTRMIEPDDSPFITRKGTSPDAADAAVPPTIAVSDGGVEENGAGTTAAVPAAASGRLDGKQTIADDVAQSEISPVPPQRTDYEDYILPPPELLNSADARVEQKEDELRDIASELAAKTKEFNVSGRVVSISPGPVVTTYEFKPDPGVKYSRVTGLVDDLCLALKAESIRIDRIPGKAFVGIEVPNRVRETIRLRDVIESAKFKESESKLTLALGKAIDGTNYVTDLAKMPHLLIAGATGAGKSVGVNTLVVSILYKARPDEVKFIMVDPKRLELGLYADIPHLLHPIIVDPKKASAALRNMVAEMERRYKYLAGWSVRNIDGYNEEAKRRNDRKDFNENGEPHPKLPYIVIIIDELADLMMVSGKDVEESITRLAQMARAVGIHLVLATQRPSVDVITGLIKANFPARISFRVSSRVDSRTIIDGSGAEGLLGRGDMLFLPPASSQVVRVHGAFVDEKEIAKIVDHIKPQGKAEYDDSITRTEEEEEAVDGELPGKKDPLFWDAVRFVVQNKRASTSVLQRFLRIGYGRAAAILDAMEREGFIGEMESGTRARPVLQKAIDELNDQDEMKAGS